MGDTIIETPNVIRGRSLETGSYRRLLMEYYDSGARWFSAPKPLLEDRLFEFDPAAPAPQNFEPAFDAANILRFGRDLLYLVSATGNELGGQWLQRMLGDQFRVHFMKDVYFGSHIDSTLVALRPGLVLANPERLSMANHSRFSEGLGNYLQSTHGESGASQCRVSPAGHRQRVDRHELIQSRTGYRCGRRATRAH